MKLLYVTDKFDFANHSFIDSVIDKYLKNFLEVDLIYWTRNEFLKKDNKFLIPYRKNIKNFIDLQQYDVIIVRNFFRVLKEVLRDKSYKVGFQLSFPHTYRRLYQAKVEKKAILRKTIEYKMKTFFEKKLIKKCDFFFPISEEMKKTFFSDIEIPYMILPLGLDEDYIIKKNFIPHSTLKMIYIGTIDKLRRFNLVLEHLKKFKNKNWLLDIYSKTSISIPPEIQNKVKLKGFLEREKLLQKISEYDIGIFLLPENKLYNVASPTKVMEYYQAGIPAIMSNIPECKELFYPNKGFFMNIEKLNFDVIFNTSYKELYNMGLEGQKILREKRNYKKIAKELFYFIMSIKN